MCCVSDQLRDGKKKFTKRRSEDLVFLWSFTSSLCVFRSVSSSCVFVSFIGDDDKNGRLRDV